MAASTPSPAVRLLLWHLTTTAKLTCLTHSTLVASLSKEPCLSVLFPALDLKFCLSWCFQNPYPIQSSALNSVPLFPGLCWHQHLSLRHARTVPRADSCLPAPKSLATTSASHRFSPQPSPSQKWHRHAPRVILIPPLPHPHLHPRDSPSTSPSA